MRSSIVKGTAFAVTIFAVSVSGLNFINVSADTGNGNSTPGLNRYMDNPGRQQATEVGVFR